MTKINLQDFASLTANELSSTQRLNANNAEIEISSDTFLSRTGEAPNQMLADLDMNSNNIINIPRAVRATEPVRYDQFLEFILGIGGGGGQTIVLGAGIMLFMSRNLALAAEIPDDINSIRTEGYLLPGDGGGALYVRASSEPTHGGKFQSADGTWWELAESVTRPEMFGGFGQASTVLVNDCAQAITDARDYYRVHKANLVLHDIYETSSPLQLDNIEDDGFSITGTNLTDGLHLIGNGVGGIWPSPIGSIGGAINIWGDLISPSTGYPGIELVGGTGLGFNSITLTESPNFAIGDFLELVINRRASLQEEIFSGSTPATTPGTPVNTYFIGDKFNILIAGGGPGGFQTQTVTVDGVALTRHVGYDWMRFNTTLNQWQIIPSFDEEGDPVNEIASYIKFYSPNLPLNTTNNIKIDVSHSYDKYFSSYVTNVQNLGGASIITFQDTFPFSVNPSTDFLDFVYEYRTRKNIKVDIAIYGGETTAIRCNGMFNRYTEHLDIKLRCTGLPSSAYNTSVGYENRADIQSDGDCKIPFDACVALHRDRKGTYKAKINNTRYFGFQMNYCSDVDADVRMSRIEGGRGVKFWSTDSCKVTAFIEDVDLDNLWFERNSTRNIAEAFIRMNRRSAVGEIPSGGVSFSYGNNSNNKVTARIVGTVPAAFLFSISDQPGNIDNDCWVSIQPVGSSDPFNIQIGGLINEDELQRHNFVELEKEIQSILIRSVATTSAPVIGANPLAANTEHIMRFNSASALHPTIPAGVTLLNENGEVEIPLAGYYNLNFKTRGIWSVADQPVTIRLTRLPGGGLTDAEILGEVSTINPSTTVQGTIGPVISKTWFNATDLLRVHIITGGTTFNLEVGDDAGCALQIYRVKK